MPDKHEPDKTDRSEDESTPETAPEVPDFAVVSDSDDRESGNDIVEPKKIAVSFSDEHTKTTDASSDEHSNTESHEDSNAQTETIPLDHQIAASTGEVSAKPKRSKKRLLAYSAFIAANIAILVSTIVVLRLPQKQVAASASGAKAAASDPGNTNVDTSKVPETPKSLHYVSDAMKVEFDYPSNWRISSNPDNTYITIQSAPFSVKTTENKNLPVKAYLTIYAKYPDGNFDVESSSQIAAVSDKLVYKNPTKVQRTDTYLSYTQSSLYGNTNIINAAFISSDLTYSTRQLVGSKNFRKTNPFIIFRLTECKDCSQPTDFFPVDANSFQNLDEFKTAKDMITSMRFN